MYDEEDSLFGPDFSDDPVMPVEEVGDKIEVWSRQFVNRWVFLPHQRQFALLELEQLIAEVKVRCQKSLSE